MTYAGFYINLDRSQHRRSHIEAELARHNLRDNYSRFAGADGNILGLPNPSLTAGEIGCFISHYMVLRQNLGCTSHIHVIEDDTVLSDITRFTVDQFTSQDALDGFDMIFTQTGLNYQDIVSCKRQFEQAGIVRDDAGKIKSFTVSRIQFRSCMGSYMVNRHSIPKILALYQDVLHKGAGLPVDLYIQSMVTQGKLRAVCLFPFVTTDLPGAGSVIEGRNGSPTSRHVTDIVRRSFFIDRDLPGLLQATIQAVPYDETDLFAQVLSRNLHFLMTAEHVRF